MSKDPIRDEIPPGTLYMLILKTLARGGEMHGFEIANSIQQISDDVLQVEEGSLYPALHRMEQSGWIRTDWKLTETNREARYYRLTKAGQKELITAEKSFEQLVKGVRAVLRYA